MPSYFRYCEHTRFRLYEITIKCIIHTYNEQTSIIIIFINNVLRVLLFLWFHQRWFRFSLKWVHFNLYISYITKGLENIIFFLGMYPYQMYSWLMYSDVRMKLSAVIRCLWYTRKYSPTINRQVTMDEKINYIHIG